MPVDTLGICNCTNFW